MSLPPAPKQTSSTPAAGAVAAPTNPAAQSADVDRKIRLYGAITAMRHSRMPSNVQIAETLQYVTTHSPVDESKLSPEGKRLIADVREIIGTAARIVESKNADEVFQRFVWATRSTDTDVAAVQDEKAPAAEKEANKHAAQAKSDAQEAGKHLRTLLSLVLTNSEMRKLLTDAATVGRDVLARGAAEAAQRVAPHPDALGQADQPAPQDHFVDKDTPIAAAFSSPGAPAAGAPSTGETPQVPTRSGSSSSSSDDDDDEEEGVEKKEKKQSLMARVKGMRTAHQDKLDAGKAWADDYFPAERREQWIWRGKKVVIECQKHADYQASMSWLLDTVSAWAVRAREAGAGAHSQASGIAEHPALHLLRTLLERFANGASMQPVFDAAAVLAKDAQNDAGLRAWWEEVAAYMRKVLLQSGYIIEPACGSRAQELQDQGRGFYQDKYKGHFDNLFDATATWFKSIAADPLNKQFGADWSRLTRDLLFDGEGNLQFKKTLWEDVRVVILPALIDHVGYVPIPRVEYTDAALDLVIENLTLSGRNLFPNVVEIEAHNYVKFSPYGKGAGDAARHEVTFTFAQIQADMRGVAFYFRTKSGLKMSDSGLADVVLGGQGVTATVTLTSSAATDPTSVFAVQRVRVKVGTLKFSIRDSKHDLLYKMLKPLATRLVKTQIKKALTDGIRTAFEYADGQLVGVRARMAEAHASEDGSRREVLADIFKRKKDDAGSVVSSASASQFKVVANKRNSLLPAAGNPAGWVNRTAAKDELAVQGDEWRSDAFDIVNAKKHDAPSNGAPKV
ncbi:hypothetical protein FB451DRAFT_1477676 [Mycena latifolia]|nr:hypothetical protein FB451DRAFT_1477676 [Mycena latifolia]